MIRYYYEAYDKLSLKLNTDCSLWRRYQCFFIMLANSIFWWLALEFFLYQNNLQADCHSTFLSILSKPILGYIKDLDNKASSGYFLSPPEVFLILNFWLFCHYSITEKVLFSYPWYSQYKDFCELIHLK